MTDDELMVIEDRNARRKELKKATTQAKWVYESFAYIDAGAYTQAGTVALSPDKHMCIIVRPQSWLDFMMNKYGTHFLDEQTTGSMQPYHDAHWIAETHNDLAENDVDALIAEVRRLKSKI